MPKLEITSIQGCPHYCCCGANAFHLASQYCIQCENEARAIVNSGEHHERSTRIHRFDARQDRIAF